MKKIMVYTLSTCPWCHKTKQFFKEQGIPFDYIDYDLADDEQQEQIRTEMSQTTRTTGFPYVKIDEDIVVGWNPQKISELLEL
ncbi:MAG: glutaredoxin family protein [Candidatus Bathyarchaeota archaeon]|nr:MAG: glutaredoxin family protein [Candidatus Bathyarchaeota archaeon]